MSVEVKGFQELMRRLEKEYGTKAMNRLSDRALKAGAQVFLEELQEEVKTFSDDQGYSRGRTYEEITLSDPLTENGVRTIKVYWQGPDGRYRIIHLNEFGTVKNPNPRGKGAIARALKNAEKAYRAAIKREIERG